MSSLHDDLIVLKKAAESMPSTEKTSEILDLIYRGDPFDRLFFEKLNDPAWLPLLDYCGFFRNLPGVTTLADGKQLYPFHLPLFGLAQLASKAPQAVSAILSKLELPENQTVGDQVLRCVAAIREPTCIPILHPILIRLGQSPSRSSWIWIQELLKYWLEVKAHPDVLTILNSYLIATASSMGKSNASDEWAIKQVDQIALEPLTANYSMQIATIVFRALVQYAEHGTSPEKLDKHSEALVVEAYLGDDYMSSFAVEDFNVLTSYQTFETILAHRLFLVSQVIYVRAEAREVQMLDDLLRSHSWNLFKRLRWHLYADFPALSVERAKKDVLERIPFLNRYEFTHYHEFARLLQIHAAYNGSKFLSREDIERFFQVVLTGPVENIGDNEKESFKKAFQRKQLWPISSLFENNLAKNYEALLGDAQITLRAYQPFRNSGVDARFIQSTAPKEVEKIEKYSDEELWDAINNWHQKTASGDSPAWWIQEDYGVFAKKFAELVDTKPERFSAQSKWWENLNRPEPLFEPLNRAIERIQKKTSDKKQDLNVFLPSENDWQNWFGLARRIILLSKNIQNLENDTRNTSEGHRRQGDWYWPRIVVSNFLTATVQSELDETKAFLDDAGQLLKELASMEDSGLQGLENNLLEEWLTTAINTVRGHAFEGILKLALRQKNSEQQAPSWIFDFIRDHLNLPEQSPAIFALMGANLRLFVHLFGESLKAHPEILFPKNRPLHEMAAIVAHFCFDHPMTGILDTFPDFLSKAVATLNAVLADSDKIQEKQKPRDFALQVGVHICFYSWNGALSQVQSRKALDQFFSLARSETRASVIRQIAWIFEKTEKDQATDESQTIFRRVMHLWEWRYEQIVDLVKKNDSSWERYERELAAFLNWVVCECFAFEWRFYYAMSVIRMLKKAPDIHHLLDKLLEWHDLNPERNKQSLQMLAAMFAHPSDQMRWQIQFKRLAPLLIRGLNSGDEEARLYATQCQDLLLKMGLFEFIDLTGVKERLHDGL
jgi:hypothetical protein